MRPFFPLLILLSLLIWGCQNSIVSSNNKQNAAESIEVDSTIQDTLKNHIQNIEKFYSIFKTPIEVRFYSCGSIIDSIIQPDFIMVSWYHNHNDTIDLVAHIGELETQALLLRFIGRKIHVFFYRAPHENQHYFRINKTDSFSNQIEVPPVNYKLELSKIPDTVSKPIVYGFIDMESSDYYDKRDSLQLSHRIAMKFYFRSQYRTYDY
jgi:hypothetical protein